MRNRPCREVVPVTMHPMDYLRAILTAYLDDIAVTTPLSDAPRLSARLGNEVLLKREDLQPIFSFKIRGAANKLRQLCG